jgi:hypothetical protein
MYNYVKRSLGCSSCIPSNAPLRAVIPIDQMSKTPKLAASECIRARRALEKHKTTKRDTNDRVIEGFIEQSTWEASKRHTHIWRRDILDNKKADIVIEK